MPTIRPVRLALFVLLFVAVPHQAMALDDSAAPAPDAVDHREPDSAYLESITPDQALPDGTNCVTAKDCWPCNDCVAGVCLPTQVTLSCSDATACPTNFDCIAPDGLWCHKKCTIKPGLCVNAEDCLVVGGCKQCLQGKCGYGPDVQCVVGADRAGALQCKWNALNCSSKCVPYVAPDAAASTDVGSAVGSDVIPAPDTATDSKPDAIQTTGDATLALSEPIAGDDGSAQAKPPETAVAEALADSSAQLQRPKAGAGSGPSSGCAASFSTTVASPWVWLITLTELRNAKASSRWRNQALAWFFLKLKLAQAEGQGVATMRRAMRAHGCALPRFTANVAQVRCELRALVVAG